MILALFDRFVFVLGDQSWGRSLIEFLCMGRVLLYECPWTEQNRNFKHILGTCVRRRTGAGIRISRR